MSFPQIQHSVFNHFPTSCALCLEDYTTNASNRCLKLKCGHIFHEICVEGWVRDHKTCPLCMRVSVFSIPEPIRKIFNRGREVFASVLNKSAIMCARIGLVFLVGAACEMVWRSSQNLPFHRTVEEVSKALEQDYRHNLALGLSWKPLEFTYRRFFGVVLITPCVIAGVFSIYTFAKFYFKNRIMIDPAGAVPVDYTPPPAVT